MEGLLERWAALGYRMERTTEVPGTMSRRGGIVDIFPTGDPYPVRLEFWGDVFDKKLTYRLAVVNSLNGAGNRTITTDPSQLDGNPALLFRAMWHVCAIRVARAPFFASQRPFLPISRPRQAIWD